MSPTQQDFQEFVPRYITNQVMPLLQGKGKEYSNTGAFDNFEQGAEVTGLSPALVLLTYATKHWLAIIKWAKGGTLEQTSVVERIQDIIIYLLLLAFMVQIRLGKMNVRR